jgi:hypothetical protein
MGSFYTALTMGKKALCRVHDEHRKGIVEHGKGFAVYLYTAKCTW